MGEILRQLEYSTAWLGVTLLKADRWLVIDRDLNAALNLKNLAGSSPVTACGADVRRPDARKGVRDAAAVKQEPNVVALASC